MAPDFCERLDDYLLKDLNPEETSAFRRHLAECESCRLTVEQQDWLDGLLKAGTESIISCPPELAPRIRREHGRRFERRRAVLGGVLAAGLMIGFLGWSLALRIGQPDRENELARETAPPRKSIPRPDANEDQPELSPAEPPSPVQVEFSDNVLAVPIETGDPDITLIQLYPVSQVSSTSP